MLEIAKEWDSNINKVNSFLNTIPEVNQLEIRVAGPLGADGYVRIDVPQSLLGIKPVSINTGENIKSSECENGECIVHYRHTNALVITLELN